MNTKHIRLQRFNENNKKLDSLFHPKGFSLFWVYDTMPNSVRPELLRGEGMHQSALPQSIYRVVR